MSRTITRILFGGIAALVLVFAVPRSAGANRLVFPVPAREFYRYYSPYHTPAYGWRGPAVYSVPGGSGPGYYPYPHGYFSRYYYHPHGQIRVGPFSYEMWH